MKKERKRKEKTTNKGEKKKKRTQQRQVEKGIGRIKHSSVTKSTLPSCMVMVSKNMKKNHYATETLQISIVSQSWNVCNQLLCSTVHQPQNGQLAGLIKLVAIIFLCICKCVC